MNTSWRDNFQRSFRKLWICEDFESLQDVTTSTNSTIGEKHHWFREKLCVLMMGILASFFRETVLLAPLTKKSSLFWLLRCSVDSFILWSNFVLKLFTVHDIKNKRTNTLTQHMNKYQNTNRKSTFRLMNFSSAEKKLNANLVYVLYCIHYSVDPVSDLFSIFTQNLHQNTC